MRLYDRVLGSPFVYNYIRPLVVGVDFSPLYERLGAGPGSIVLDVGCGTGDALNHLTSFERYAGFDIDEAALAFARSKHGQRPGVTFDRKLIGEEDIARLSPTHVVLGGLLHHVDDAGALGLLRSLLRSPRLERAVSLDIVYLPGSLVNNLFARLDRGRYCRTVAGYEELVARAGLRRTESAIVLSHPKRGRVKYLVMTMEPPHA
jgi:SAM-dependent methyltransferase